MSLRSGLRCLFLYLCAVVAAFAADFRPGMVLVKYHPDATEADIAELQSRKGLRLTKHIKLFGIYAYAYDAATTGPVEFSRELAKEPIVQTAEPDHVRELNALDPEYPKQWSLRNTGQVVNGKSGPAGFDIRWPEANLLYKPKSTLVVGVIDSGVTLLHPDLVGSVHVKTSESINGFNGIDEDGNGLIDDLWGYDWYDLDPLPTDQHGHGTLVSSIIAGTIGNGQGIAGITNSVKIRGYRVFNQFGRSGQPKFKSGGYAVSDVLASVATAVDDGCKVINLSLGGGAYSALEAGAFDEISTMQVLCVIASGNDGKNNDLNPTYPASYPAASIIAVAAQDRTGGLANFSNYGVQTTDLAAPGTDIRGADVTRRVIYASNFSTGLNGWSPFRYTANDYSYASWTTSGGYLVDRTYGSYYSPWTDTYARSPLIDARNYSGVRVEYEGAFDIANDTLSVDLSLDGLNWDTYKQYAWAGSGVDQFDASDMDLSRFYLRFRLRSDGFSQGIGAGIRSLTISAINDLDTANPSYQFSNGTSFSAPIVSGVVCMVWTQQPSLTAAQVKEIILKSVRKVPALDGKVLTGGMVDAEAALKLAAVYAGDVPPMVTVPPRGGFFLQGDSVTLTVGSTSGLSVTYQWRKNGVNISGERGSTFSIGSLAIADAGMYDVVVTSQAGSVTSASAQLTVSARLPSILTQPVLPASVMIAGESYQMSCSAAGTPPLTYQWMKNGVAIAGATSPIFSIGQLATVDAGAYSVKVGNAAGSVISSAVNVAVTQRPAFTTNLPTAPVNLTAGGAHVLFVAATGTPLPAYQWRRNGVNIPGAVGAAYLVLAGTVEASNTYDVVITNTAGSVTSAAATVRTNVPVTVASAPAARSVVAGQAASFSVAAAGTGPFTYQWLRNGLAIAGATASTYDIAAVSGADAGIYSARVTGPIGSVISTGGTLSVLAPFTIATQPSAGSPSIAVVAGVTKVLSVAVTGSGPFTYQWRKEGVAIAGATAASYVVPSASSESITNYDVVIVGPVNSATSNSVAVVNCLPLSIAQHPAAMARAVGQQASFSVTAAGTGPFAYQWLKNGLAIAGATASTYAIDAVTAASVAGYSVKVTGPVGSLTSNSALLALHVAPGVTTQPASLFKASGQAAAFTVVASGTGPFNYQWSKDGNAIAGANLATLTLPSVTAGDVGRYSVSVSNAVGAVLSQEAELQLVTAPAISEQPVSQGFIPKVLQTYRVRYFGFSAGPDGWSVTTTEQGWLQNWGQPGWYWNPYLDEIPLNPSAANLEGGFGATVSSPWISLVGVSSPELRFVCMSSQSGGSATPGTLTMQVSADGASWTTVFTKTNDSAMTNHVVNLEAYAGKGCYVRALTTSSCVAYLDEVEVWGYGLPTNSANLSVAASGGGLSYQWYKDGILIPGATSANYAAADVYAAGVVGGYTVKVSNAAGSINSTSALLAIKPGIATQPANLSKLAGQSAAFSVVASGTGPFTYQWYRNGSAISGATSATCSIASASAQTAGSYHVVVSNAVGQVTSQAVALAVTLPPALTSQPQSSTLVRIQSQGTLAKFDFDTGLQSWTFGAMPDDLSSTPWEFGWDDLAEVNGLVSCENFSGRSGHQFARSPWISLLGASNVSLRFSANTYGPAGKNLTLEASGDGVNWSVLKANCPAYNDPGYQASYTVSLAAFAGKGCYLRARFLGPSGSMALVDDFLITGYGYPATTVTFSATASSSVPCTYQWYRNGVAIAGATSSTYSPSDPYASTSAGTYTVVVTNVAGSVTSSSASLIQVDAPVITSQPAAQSVAGSYTAPLTTANYTFDTGASGWVYGANAGNQSPYHWDWDSATSSLTDRLYGTTYASYGDVYTQSPWLNLSNSIGSTLTFNSYWSLFADSLDTFYVQASSNGTNWTTLKAYTGSGNVSTTVSLSAYDLYGCYLRFGLYSSPLYNGYGVNVYDARVSGSTLVPGAPATFAVAATSATSCAYQWFKDGSPIAGATSNSYYIPYTYSSDAGLYSVRVTNAAGSVTSSSARLSFR